MAIQSPPLLLSSPKTENGKVAPRCFGHARTWKRFGSSELPEWGREKGSVAEFADRVKPQVHNTKISHR